MGVLRIAEIFTSVQGEGIWSGIPSIFVRVSGCNLRCQWCDTPYASWKPEGPTLSLNEIMERVTKDPVRHVVLTGGEPMLFDAIVPLAEALRAAGKVITIETAGTVDRSLPCDLVSISPKLANSTPTDETWSARHEVTRHRPDVVRSLVQAYNYQLKFVVNPEAGDDLAEIDELLAEVGPVDPERVLLMPEGTDSETLHRRGRALVPVCLERNWRLAPRLHIDLFGNTKGT